MKESIWIARYARVDRECVGFGQRLKVALQPPLVRMGMGNLPHLLLRIPNTLMVQCDLPGVGSNTVLVPEGIKRNHMITYPLRSLKIGIIYHNQIP